MTILLVRNSLPWLKEAATRAMGVSISHLVAVDSKVVMPGDSGRPTRCGREPVAVAAKARHKPRAKLAKGKPVNSAEENWFKISEFDEAKKIKKKIKKNLKMLVGVFIFSCCCGKTRNGSVRPSTLLIAASLCAFPPAHSHRYTVCEDVRCLLGSLARRVVWCGGPRTAGVIVVIFFVLA